jgi:hypothetical protein
VVVPANKEVCQRKDLCLSTFRHPEKVLKPPLSDFKNPLCHFKKKTGKKRRAAAKKKHHSLGYLQKIPMPFS